jgi:uncharacterized protein YukE
MPASELNYPPEVPPMVADMRKVVDQVNSEMDVLAKSVGNLNGSSRSQAVGSLTEVHQQWTSVMSDHIRVLDDVAAKTRQGYDDMIAFDAYAAKQIQGG